MATIRVPVLPDRIITIPEEFYNELGFKDEAICELRENEIYLSPVKDEQSDDFSVRLLADLIKKGYEGQDLLEKFKEGRREAASEMK